MPKRIKAPRNKDGGLNDPTLREKILNEIAEGEYTINDIIDNAHVGRKTYYKRLDEDPVFKRAVDEAFLKRRFKLSDKAERELLKRVEGYTKVEKTVETQESEVRGRVITVREAEKIIIARDQTLLDIIKNGFPDRYGVGSDQSNTLNTRADYDALLEEVKILLKDNLLDGEEING